MYHSELEAFSYVDTHSWNILRPNPPLGALCTHHVHADSHSRNSGGLTSTIELTVKILENQSI